MNNSYILSILAGFGFGLLITLLNPLQKNERKQSGFNIPQKMIQSKVDDVKSDKTFQSSKDFNYN